MPPSPTAPRLPLPRVFLERVARPVLARLLSPHGDALTTRHAFPLAAPPQLDRTHVDALWRLLSSPPPDLLALHDDLTAVADVATRSGHERLLALDTARVLDHELGDEDSAAIAFLDHRALFDAARPQTASSQTRSFASFESQSPRALPDAPARAVTFDRLMREELLARGRSDHFKRHEWHVGTERHFELVYGRLATTRDLLGKPNGDATAAHDVTAQVTDRSSERARAVFHDDTFRLEVAGPDWFKEIVRRIFGVAYFDSATHFEGDETLTLDPLVDLTTALANHGVPGLAKIELQEVWIDMADGSGWIATGARNDCTKGATGGYAIRALSEGKPVEATFHLYLTGKSRPLTLKVVTPRKLEFARRDPRVVRIVRDWIVAAGYMTMPTHLRASDDGRPSDDAPAAPLNALDAPAAPLDALPALR